MRQFHLGIYGLIEKEEQFLVVRKSRGPYKNLLDLPGGSPQHGEAPLETLKRELKEEIGMEATDITWHENLAFIHTYSDFNNALCELYHVALIYLVNDAHLLTENLSIINEDVNGSEWIQRSKINEQTASPLLLKALEAYEKNNLLLF